MPLRIAIDSRHVRDFGVGTYIRNLVHSLAAIDTEDRFLLVLPPDEHLMDDVPANFEIVRYARADEALVDHLAFPWFLRGLDANLVHIPLNRVPLLMPRPYVVTIHDMASLIFEERSGVKQTLWRFRFRQGLVRANAVIAVSAATRRDVQNEFLQQ